MGNFQANSSRVQLGTRELDGGIHSRVDALLLDALEFVSNVLLLAKDVDGCLIFVELGIGKSRLEDYLVLLLLFAGTGGSHVAAGGANELTLRVIDQETRGAHLEN